jgi:hypothetical protein
VAVFAVLVQTVASGQFISNTYHVEATSISNALEQGRIIAHCHKNLLPPYAFINRIRAWVPNSEPDVFYTETVNIAGTRPASTQPLPLFNRFRVDFSIGPRRPLRKFLLWPTEGDSSGGTWEAAAIAFVTTNYIDCLLDNPLLTMTGADGSPVFTGALVATPGMHQLRRARRRSTPIIP